MPFVPRDRQRPDRRSKQRRSPDGQVSNENAEAVRHIRFFVVRGDDRRRRIRRAGGL